MWRCFDKRGAETSKARNLWMHITKAVGKIKRIFSETNFWYTSSHYINKKESVKGLLEWLLPGLNILVSQSALPQSGQCVTPWTPSFTHTLPDCSMPHAPLSSTYSSTNFLLRLSSGNLLCCLCDLVSAFSLPGLLSLVLFVPPFIKGRVMVP